LDLVIVLIRLESLEIKNKNELKTEQPQYFQLML